MALIYDVGAHDGESTDFFLKKGFSVVAIEASPGLCERLRERFAPAVATGTLRIVNVAIAERSGEIPFHVNERVSQWSTTNPAYVERSRLAGSPPTRTIVVRAERLDDVIREHGAAHYVKIDIEGADLQALRSLDGLTEKPRYVSVEAEKTSWDALLTEFETFRDLGYKRYKLVNQQLVRFQDPPEPALEGLHVEYRFAGGSSGLFGAELPGAWLDATEAIERYQRIFEGYFLNGDSGIFRRRAVLLYALVRLQQRLAHWRGFRGFADPIATLPHHYWYDTHAAR